MRKTINLFNNIVQEIHIRCIDRTDWESGSWDDEPDFIQWIDPKTRLLCLMTRNHFGAWCGYVGVPKGHKYYKKHYDDVEVSCHGGLTYSDTKRSVKSWRGDSITHTDIGRKYCNYSQEEYSKLWFVGFDCAHYLDQFPSDPIAKYAKMTGATTPIRSTGVYRDEKYVRKECTNLAKQLFQPTALEKEILKIKKEVNAGETKKKGASKTKKVRSPKERKGA